MNLEACNFPRKCQLIATFSAGLSSAHAGDGSKSQGREIRGQLKTKWNVTNNLISTINNKFDNGVCRTAYRVTIYCYK